MASTVNKVTLIGHLGDDVKMHYFEGGSSLGRFSLATNDMYMSKETGERISNVEWHNLVVRNKLAEVCEKYLSKGDKIYCEGRIKSRKWEQDGTTHYMTEIHVREMTFIRTKKDTSVPVSPGSSDMPTPSSTAPKVDKPIGTDDLPF